MLLDVVVFLPPGDYRLGVEMNAPISRGLLQIVERTDDLRHERALK